MKHVVRRFVYVRSLINEDVDMPQAGISIMVLFKLFYSQMNAVLHWTVQVVGVLDMVAEWPSF